MFTFLQNRSDFADTTALSPALTSTWATGQTADPIDLLNHVDQADRTLLQLVLCAASATLLLALAASLTV